MQIIVHFSIQIVIVGLGGVREGHDNLVYELLERVMFVLFEVLLLIILHFNSFLCLRLLLLFFFQNGLLNRWLILFKHIGVLFQVEILVPE